ncbi:hypothetical protein SAICODRAFT_30295 [Saitoella complicata NRRL Y-17804]|uniref:uncharacterized protein n=1 Tax=Saitoella complicata (strain BCRC 22490 / CBS 7301 / JCM 7358 / NBRC 10748 / NRRL Y-17804) TaxID=698492 RepID=UPI0008676734|nr:uncharacterized protein SAICODRAFT_30295 [Saitoella complicata NRRL Y-17804]ODQ53261.1 hypothetical protein SAICODRAFT_30295 [Saitoella complicata NRRL Y-17804]
MRYKAARFTLSHAWLNATPNLIWALYYIEVSCHGQVPDGTAQLQGFTSFHRFEQEVFAQHTLGGNTRPRDLGDSI